MDHGGYTVFVLGCFLVGFSAGADPQLFLLCDLASKETVTTVIEQYRRCGVAYATVLVRRGSQGRLVSDRR